MTLHEITERVSAIRVKAYDDEVAHSMQDELYLDFIQYVASAPRIPLEDLAELASKVAEVDTIEFCRWCA